MMKSPFYLGCIDPAQPLVTPIGCVEDFFHYRGTFFARNGWWMGNDVEAWNEYARIGAHIPQPFHERSIIDYTSALDIVHAGMVSHRFDTITPSTSTMPATFGLFRSGESQEVARATLRISLLGYDYPNIIKDGNFVVAVDDDHGGFSWTYLYETPLGQHILESSERIWREEGRVSLSAERLVTHGEGKQNVFAVLQTIRCIFGDPPPHVARYIGYMVQGSPLHHMLQPLMVPGDDEQAPVTELGAVRTANIIYDHERGVVQDIQLVTTLALSFAAQELKHLFGRADLERTHSVSAIKDGAAQLC